MRRCSWIKDERMTLYHDREWGVPVHDDRLHFEFLVLGGAQAGLSWATILHRRDGYRSAFADFDPARVAGFDRKKIAALLRDPGIIRNRQKVESAVRNARAFLAVRKEFGSFDDYVWCFAPGKSRAPRTLAQIPARTPASDALSADLIERGFSFAGSTICYAYMQAAGLVNDHVVGCFRRAEVERLRNR
jgi:DNA-3-methyladenine glycosylase I